MNDKEFYTELATSQGKTLYDLILFSRNWELRQLVLHGTHDDYLKEMAKRDSERIAGSGWSKKRISKLLPTIEMAFERPYHYGRDYTIYVLGEPYTVTAEAIYEASFALGYELRNRPAN